MSKIVDIRDVVLRFYTYEGTVKALEGVNLHVNKGETLGLVGETGCGKTMTSLSIFNLIPSPGQIEGGEVLFRGRDGEVEDLLSLEERDLYQVRGDEISMIFQEPTSALNPVYTVNRQVSEVFLAHRKEELIEEVLDELEDDIRRVGEDSLKGRIYKLETKIYQQMLKKDDSFHLRVLSKIPVIKRYKGRLEDKARSEVINILRELGMSDPERVVDMYPHELSGGMQQRVVIAMALACNPLLLAADEPTTSLDVTIQARILNLIRRLKERFGASVLFVTHDLGVIAEMCDRVAVMYAGTVVELAEIEEIFKNPLHPYTQGLMSAIPRPGKEYKTIRGTVPNLIDPPQGCRFHPRCPYAMEICTTVKPMFKEIREGHFISCHLYGGNET